MSLYLVERSDETDYDEFEAFVVRANSEEEARQIAHEGSSPRRPESRNEGFLDGPVTKISGRGKAKVILGAFRAG